MMKNTWRLTALSFLAYFVMSGMLAPWGVISGSVAEFFGTTEIDVTERFGWLTGGNLAGAILALRVYRRFGIRTLMLTLYALIFASAISLLLARDLQSIQIAFGLIGTCCGVGLAGAALTISLTYQAERRASMLVITDACFSIAGYLCSAIAVLFVSWTLHWSMTYQFVGFFALIIVLLSAFSSFPQANPASSIEASQGWPPTAWLCIAGLFLYTLGQWSMLWWLPTHIQESLGAPADEAGNLVSLFWLGMLASQLFVAWLVLKVGARQLVVLAAITTVSFSIPLWTVTNLNLLPALSVLWGFANFGLLKMVLSFATETLAIPSSTLVSALLLGATTGTAVSPFVTSQIVERWGTLSVLQFSSACYAVLGVVLLLSVALFRKPAS